MCELLTSPLLQAGRMCDVFSLALFADVAKECCSFMSFPTSCVISLWLNAITDCMHIWSQIHVFWWISVSVFLVFHTLLMGGMGDLVLNVICLCSTCNNHLRRFRKRAHFRELVLCSLILTNILSTPREEECGGLCTELHFILSFFPVTFRYVQWYWFGGFTSVLNLRETFKQNFSKFSVHILVALPVD